ncbi:putative protein Ecm13 [Septoria linicola]|nr:putative protein Ecm13 [Septoria linicola]
MHVSRWAPYKHFKCLAKHIAAHMAQILQSSTRCRIPAQTQVHCTTPSPSPSPSSATETQDENNSLVESNTEDLHDRSITEAYHLAGIAHARLQKEAKRHDHDLRLLVGHANFLDQLTERIEEVDPEFTIESLEPANMEPSSHSMTLPRLLSRTRIDDILRNIDLSDDEGGDEVDDEVYNESDDDSDDGSDDDLDDKSEDDLDEPVSPQQESFVSEETFQMPLLKEGMVSKVYLPLEQLTFDETGEEAYHCWQEQTSHHTIRRKDSMPIVTVTFLDDAV